MSNQSLTCMLETCWEQISLGTSDRHHAARNPVLATTTPDGPAIRTLVLRGVSRDDSTIEFHSDALSPKIKHIKANPSVALHFWIPKVNLQIRIRAMAQLLPGDPELFAQLPAAAQANYKGPVPGAELPAEHSPASNRFTRIQCHLMEIDALLLTGSHKRAFFEVASDWQGKWIAP